MRVPSNEFLPSEMGLTNDPMIHKNLIEGTKERNKKGSTVAVVLCVLAIVALAAFIYWGVTAAPGP